MNSSIFSVDWTGLRKEAKQRKKDACLAELKAMAEEVFLWGMFLQSSSLLELAGNMKLYLDSYDAFMAEGNADKASDWLLELHSAIETFRDIAANQFKSDRFMDMTEAMYKKLYDFWGWD
jgi:hypothetical protein